MTSPNESPALARFQSLLRELFQFDSADLDFGIYRILNARRGMFEDWINTRLPAEVRKALSSGAVAQADAQAQRLAGLAAKLREEQEDDAIIDGDGRLRDGIPGKTAREYRELWQAQQAGAQPAGADARAADIYNRLYDFFRRYYEDGDFLSLRRYGADDAYAVPYNGQEVLLHWANRDQYYVKTGEHFTDYRFRAGDSADAWHIEFKLQQAQTDRDNTKASDKRHFFFDTAAATLGTESRTLTVPAAWRAPTAAEAGILPSRNAQDAVNADAEKKLLGKKSLKDHPMLLAALKFNVAGEGDAPQSLLARHLRRYTRRNTSDFFIHKDLRGFLTRELDYWLKAEVLKLDTLLAGGEQPAHAWLQTLACLRDIATNIIDFVARIEDFQKRLYEKRKFITESHWCLTLDHVERAGLTDALVKVLNDTAGGKAQKAEWKRLFAIDETKAEGGKPGWKDNVTADFLRSQPFLVLDTVHLPQGFTDTLLASIGDLDAATDGLLVHGDNWQALNLLMERYREQVQCVYIDPPFNTGLGDFFYRDSYQHSSWLSMMSACTSSIHATMTSSGTLYAHIDYYEKERLKLLLDESYYYITEIIWRIGWISGYKSKANKFIRNHDTIYQYGKGPNVLFNKQYIPYPAGYVRRDGNAPEGEGYPLEDTWNCTDIDSMNSIQIVSFSKEKVGDQSLTQKNEALLDRVLISSSNPGDFVLDAFVGSGTTAAVAQKSGRRWIAIEMGANFDAYTLPRLKKVIFGDRYGVSEKYGYRNGGAFRYLRLESYEDTLANLRLRADAPGQGGLDLDALPDVYRLGYWLDVETAASASLLDVGQLEQPFDYALTVHDGKAARTQAVDLAETFNYLIGLIVRRRRVLDRDGRRYLLYLGRTRADDAATAVLWRDIRDWTQDDFAAERDWIAAKAPFDGSTIIYVNGDSAIPGAQSLDPVFHARMFAPVH